MRQHNDIDCSEQPAIDKAGTFTRAYQARIWVQTPWNPNNLTPCEIGPLHKSVSAALAYGEHFKA